MISTTGIPIAIEPEATEYVAGHELRPALGRILESVTQIFPGLRGIRVKLEPGCEDGEVQRVIVELFVSAEFVLGDEAMQRFIDWVVANLTPEEWQYFGIWRENEPANGR